MASTNNLFHHINHLHSILCKPSQDYQAATCCGLMVFKVKSENNPTKLHTANIKKLWVRATFFQIVTYVVWHMVSKLFDDWTVWKKNVIFFIPIKGHFNQIVGVSIDLINYLHLMFYYTRHTFFGVFSRRQYSLSNYEAIDSI